MHNNNLYVTSSKKRWQIVTDILSQSTLRFFYRISWQKKTKKRVLSVESFIFFCSSSNFFFWSFLSIHSNFRIFFFPCCISNWMVWDYVMEECYIRNLYISRTPFFLPFQFLTHAWNLLFLPMLNHCRLFNILIRCRRTLSLSAPSFCFSRTFFFFSSSPHISTSFLCRMMISSMLAVGLLIEDGNLIN